MSPEVRHGVTADRCDRCRAIWFDAEELNQWLAADSMAPEVGLEARIPSRGVGSRPCPRCRRIMQSVGWTGMVLDRCRRCRGLFVEAREFDDLASAPPDVQRTREERLRAALMTTGWTLLGAKGILVLIVRFVR